MSSGCSYPGEYLVGNLVAILIPLLPEIIAYTAMTCATVSTDCYHFYLVNLLLDNLDDLVPGLDVVVLSESDSGVSTAERLSVNIGW